MRNKNILIKFQRKINKEIKNFFNQKIAVTKNYFLKEILNLLKNFSLRPGKRIRAILVNLGYSLAGGRKQKEILKTSIFIELLHNYFLIHDDIIDRDKYRRGGLTIHYYFQNSSKIQKNERKHYGESMAIVAGDLMGSLGYEILTNSHFLNNYKIKAIKKLNEIIYFTGFGQMFELKLKEKLITGKLKEKEVLEIYQNKTALYSFVGPLQIGAILAGANEKFLEKIKKFSLPLGIAFQIQDDLSDIGIDFREQQPTLIRVKNHSFQYCQNLIKRFKEQSKENLNKEKLFPDKEKTIILNLINEIIK